jgi:hypothetical protein
LAINALINGLRKSDSISRGEKKQKIIAILPSSAAAERACRWKD